MAEIETKRISELIAAQDIGDSDLFVIEQGGAAKKALGSVVKEAIGGSSLPAGGTPGQVLTKTENGTEWDDVSGLPDGGNNGQVLTKTANGAAWSDAGTPTQAQTNTALADYLDEHPEAVTNIPDRIKQALLACFQKVAWIDDNGQTYYDALYDALMNKEVLSIAAVFTQGSAVIYATDSLDTLRQYLVVTASYDDGTTGEVTAYELSGTLTEGTSTITATYEGKTDTFNVTVVASRNLFDPDTDPTLDMCIATSTMKFQNGSSASAHYASSYIAVQPNTSYTITKTATNQFRVGTSAEIPVANRTVLQTEANHTGSTITITTAATANYLFFTYWYNTGSYDAATVRESIIVTEA